jgi:hypothetical protein
MAYCIYITPTAIEDINEAIDYYDEKVVGLGFKFSKDVEDNLNIIAQNPNAYAERYNSVRGSY